MFYCSYCDAQHLKWQGRCNECGKWGTLGEETAAPSKKRKKKRAPATPALHLSDAKTSKVSHTPTQIGEMDRVLSGGLVPGSVTLLAGEPGIGKSTLVAQLTGTFSRDDASPYYVSGEESEGQVLMRLERLDVDPAGVLFSNSVDVGGVISRAKKKKPSVLIVDSVQTMIAQDVDNMPGTPTAVRAATSQLIEFAKSTNTPVVIIGQVTKGGTVAGPKTLEHLVDTVLTLEGDRQTAYRILRAVKHRFGNTDEVGVFEMTGKGMQAVDNPSARFLEERQNTPGSVITCVMEGTRPFLIEVQALAEKSYFANPIRRTSGFDSGRLQMLLAIISKRAGVNVSDQDIYVNVVGGMRIRETAADLAVAAAVISSVKDKPIPKDAVVFGELGLGGEVRSVPFVKKRKKEATRQGLSNIIGPDIKHVKHVKFK